MKSIIFKTILFSFVILSFGCGGDGGMTTPPASLVEISVQESRAFEQTGNSIMLFEIFPASPPEQAVTLNYTIEGISAEPGVDFIETSGSVILEAGANRARIEITVVDDDINEVDEKMSMTLSSPDNVSIDNPTVIGVIKDNDDPSNYDDEGYQTPSSYYGYDLQWQDEFDAQSLNLEDYNFDIGDGCPNLCGWGNAELEWYTNLEQNIFLENGKLVIKALKEGDSNYTSAKIHTKDKQDFQFGRIDIRAKLPKGQGLWPAIWMLGKNIDNVGWPACGEIDIMELVGHEPNLAHGTAHWGAQGSGRSTYKGSSIGDVKGYDSQFNVFSLVWEPNQLVWYKNEVAFHTIGLNDMQGEQYRFNAPFYMIFNVAVGGQWPGSPDATTVFPQQMEIDYVRYFK